MTYDLRPMKAPRLAGMGLRAFTWAVESPLLRWALLPKLFADAGITDFRRRHLDEAPSVRPILPGCGEIGRDPGRMPTLGELSRTPRPSQDGFRFDNIIDFARAYQTGSANPLDVAERVLAAIEVGEQRSPAMRSMVTWSRDDLLAQAEASAQRHREGKTLGPLDGVPVAVKDEADALPFTTQVGSSVYRIEPTEDATPVARLRAQGALIIGKASMHEVGLGVTGLNTHFGTPRNPYGINHYPGGSSSGSCAAVAQGLAPLSLGADGGGSIRIPASFCGLVGLKATWGRISEHGAAPLCWSVGHVGPIGASALDCALGYAVMAGPDPKDPNTLNQPQAHLDGFGSSSLKGLRMGIFTPWFDDASEPVVAACRALLDHFVELGAELVEVEIPDLELCRIAHMVTITSEMATSTEPKYIQSRGGFGLETRVNFLLARQFTGRDYVKAQQARTRITQHFLRVLSKVDVVVTPTAGITAPPIPKDALTAGESDLETLGRIMPFAPQANLTGLPAISFPAGYDSDNLPIGFQAIGRPWEEHVLLKMAHLAEGKVLKTAPEVHNRLLSPPNP